jgi:hypothetical protein
MALGRGLLQPALRGVALSSAVPFRSILTFAMLSVEAVNKCRQHLIVLSPHAGLGTISGIERENCRKPKKAVHLSD